MLLQNISKRTQPALAMQVSTLPQGPQLLYTRWRQSSDTAPEIQPQIFADMCKFDCDMERGGDVI